MVTHQSQLHHHQRGGELMSEHHPTDFIIAVKLHCFRLIINLASTFIAVNSVMQCLCQAMFSVMLSPDEFVLAVVEIISFPLPCIFL